MASVYQGYNPRHPHVLYRGRPAEKVKGGNPDFVFGVAKPFGENSAYIYMGPYDRVRVSAETLCADVGLTDMDGRNVFVGDIVCGPRNSIWVVYQIPTGAYAICPRSEWKRCAVTEPYRDIILCRELTGPRVGWFKKNFRIIGNIFTSFHKLGYAPSEENSQALEGWERANQVDYVSQIKTYITKNFNLEDYGLAGRDIFDEYCAKIWLNMFASGKDVETAVREYLQEWQRILTDEQFYYAHQVKEYIQENINLGDYDLDGCELSEDDYFAIAEQVAGRDMRPAVHKYLLGIRQVLDEGLDDLDEN